MNRIDTSLVRTTVLSRFSRTAVRALALHRRIRNEIAVAITRVAFERVQETEPVARLVNGGAAFVVPARSPAGHGAGRDVAAVGDVDAGRAARGDFGREGAGSQDAAGEVGVEVDVEVGVGSDSQSGFEGIHVGAVGDGPGVVGGERGVDEVEGDADGVVGCVHGGGLVGGHFGGDGVGFGGGGYDVEVGVDGDWLLGLAADESGWGAGADGGGLVFLMEGFDGAFEVLCCLAVVHAAGMAAVDVGGVRIDEVSLVR